ncbi:MAG TPA: hypothetical protein VM389_04510 [Phycisphaerae bacterium]|nr:hypothetical protein [Phycisphaerae bacterium]
MPSPALAYLRREFELGETPTMTAGMSPGTDAYQALVAYTRGNMQPGAAAPAAPPRFGQAGPSVGGPVPYMWLSKLQGQVQPPMQAPQPSAAGATGMPGLQGAMQSMVPDWMRGPSQPQQGPQQAPGAAPAPATAAATQMPDPEAVRAAVELVIPNQKPKFYEMWPQIQKYYPTLAKRVSDVAAKAEEDKRQLERESQQQTRAIKAADERQQAKDASALESLNRTLKANAEVARLGRESAERVAGAGAKATAAVTAQSQKLTRLYKRQGELEKEVAGFRERQSVESEWKTKEEWGWDEKSQKSVKTTRQVATGISDLGQAANKVPLTDRDWDRWKAATKELERTGKQIDNLEGEGGPEEAAETETGTTPGPEIITPGYGSPVTPSAGAPGAKPLAAAAAGARPLDEIRKLPPDIQQALAHAAVVELGRDADDEALMKKALEIWRKKQNG